MSIATVDYYREEDGGAQSKTLFGTGRTRAERLKRVVQSASSCDLYVAGFRPLFAIDLVRDSPAPVEAEYSKRWDDGEV